MLSSAKSAKSQDVGRSAAAEAEADSDRHLVAEGTPHPGLGGFKVGLTTYIFEMQSYNYEENMYHERESKWDT